MVRVRFPAIVRWADDCLTACVLFQTFPKKKVGWWACHPILTTMSLIIFAASSTVSALLLKCL